MQNEPEHCLKHPIFDPSCIECWKARSYDDEVRRMLAETTIEKIRLHPNSVYVVGYLADYDRSLETCFAVGVLKK